MPTNELTVEIRDNRPSSSLTMEPNGTMVFRAKDREFLRFEPDGSAYVRGEKTPGNNAEVYEMARAWFAAVSGTTGREMVTVTRDFIVDVLKTVELLDYDYERKPDQSILENKYALLGHLMALGLDRMPYDGDLDFPKAADEMLHAKVGRDLCSMLMHYVGETGENEGAVDVLNRLLAEVHKARGTPNKVEVAKQQSFCFAPGERT